MVPLAPTEWLLMRCVWDLGEANPLAVAEHLTHRYGRDLEAKTVGILLARLVRKGYLRFTPGLVVRGRPPHVYSPLVTPKAAMRRQVEQFLEDHVIAEEELAEVLDSLMVERRRTRTRKRRS